MKNVNFKKRVIQLMAGLFGIILMGGVMFSTQIVDAQEFPQDETLQDRQSITSGSRNCQTADTSGGGGAFFYRLCSSCKTKFMTRGSSSTCTK